MALVQRVLMFRISYNIIVAVFIVVALSRPAHAYLDPGTGSIILQSIIGAVAGAMVIGRSYIYRLKAWLGSKQNERTPPR